MKSSVLGFLPLAGIASAVHLHPRAKASSCASRQTVTATTTEKVYVTVSAPGAPDAPASSPASTIDVTSTRTVDVYITVTVPPSALPPYNNHTTSALNQQSSSSSGVAYPTLSVLPTSKLEYSQAFPAVPQSEAARPSASSSAPVQYPPVAGTSSAAVAASAPVASASSSAPVQYPPVAGTSSSVAVSTPSAPVQYPPAAGTSSSAVAKPTDAPYSPATGPKKGEATFYTPDLAKDMCSFIGYTLPSGIFGTALSDSNWEGGAECGVCVSVTGPKGNKITAMIVDECPGCGPNHLDLFPEAFAKLEDPSKGVIPVSWDIVPCGITTPITLKNKDGTSKYWFAMQVINANVPISKLEVSIDGGVNWKSTTRKPYNFFEQESGFGTDTVDVKVTSTNGQSIIVRDVSIAASSTKAASSNFSA